MSRITDKQRAREVLTALTGFTEPELCVPSVKPGEGKSLRQAIDAAIMAERPRCLAKRPRGSGKR